MTTREEDPIQVPETNPITEAPVEIGGVAVPAGLTVTIVTDPTGTDAGRIIYLTGRAFGLNFSFEVGDREAFRSLFGGESFADLIDQFGGFERVSQAEFNEAYLPMGSVDEIVGTTESLAAVLERDLAAVGVESLPEWMRNSPQALTIQAVGAREGWSPQRIASELSKTAAFKERYGAFNVVAEALGTDDVLTVTNQIASMEQSIRQSIRRYRGPRAEPSTRYIQNLVRSGWSAAEVDQALEAEYRLNQNPEALDNLNELLAAAGVEGRLSRGQMVQYIAGTAPQDVFELVNDALRKTALSEQGVEISAEFARSLGEDGSLSLLDPSEFEGPAVAAARSILRFGLELDAGKYGLTREDVVSAAFGEGRSAEVDEKLSKYARERAQAARGLGGRQAYIGAEGELRVQGLQGL